MPPHPGHGPSDRAERSGGRAPRGQTGGSRGPGPADPAADPREYQWRAERSRRARRRRTTRPGRRRAENAYAAWTEEVSAQIPEGWIDAERELPEEVRALRALSAELPSADLAVKAAAIDPDRVDDPVLLELIRATQRLSSWLCAQQADLVAAFSDRATGKGKGLYVTEQISAHLSLTGYAAGKLAARAEALKEMPELHEALRTGRIDERKVDILIDGTDGLPALRARAVHRSLLPTAEVITSAQLRKRVATAAVAVDPDYARTRHEKAKKTRTVSLNAAPDGMAWINAYLPATEAMAAFTAIDALAGQKDADDDRPVGARRADAFSQVFAETLDSGYTPGGCALPRRQGARPHLMVTVAASTLAYRDDLPGQLAGYGPIGADVVRKLATGAGPYSVLHTDSATGSLTDLERRRAAKSRAARGHGTGEEARQYDAAALSGHDATELIALVAAAGALDPVAYLEEMLGLRATDSYVPSAALRDLIMTRDRTCRFVGCEQPGSRCQIDHIDPFDDSQPAWAQTVETNLHLLCVRHHQMKTGGDWKVSRDAMGNTHWTSPSGNVYRRPAEVIDPLADAHDVGRAAAALAEELGKVAEELRTEPLSDPGTAEESNPTNLAAGGESLEQIQRRLTPAQGPAGPEAHTGAEGRPDAPGGATRGSASASAFATSAPAAGAADPAQGTDARRRVVADSGKSANATGSDDEGEPPF